MQDLMERGTNMTDIILRVTPPALPIAPIQYSQTYQEIHDNVLRLYFNRLSTANIETINAINSLNTLVWLGM